jgi:hypothetical protein
LADDLAYIMSADYGVGRLGAEHSARLHGIAQHGIVGTKDLIKDCILGVM